MVEAIAGSAAAIVIVECTDGVATSSGSGTTTTLGTVITAEHVSNAKTSCNVYSEAAVTLLGTSTRWWNTPACTTGSRSSTSPRPASSPRPTWHPPRERT